VVYGAFAAVPILLIWIYTAWLLMLLGAVLAASWPDVGRPLLQKDERPGHALRQALQTLALLHQARQQGQVGLSVAALAQALQWPQDAVHAALKTLAQNDWVGALHETDPAQRHVLLVDPENTPLAPLLQQLILADDPTTTSLWQALQADRLMLSDVLPNPVVGQGDAVGRTAGP
jgi:membrane protein